jgi:hypothetical protein
MVAGCDLDLKECLTKTPGMELFRTLGELKYDYNLWEPLKSTLEEAVWVPMMSNEEMDKLVYGDYDIPELLPEEEEKRICFDCASEVWCGDCVDEEKCNQEIGCRECDDFAKCHTVTANREEPLFELVEAPDHCDGYPQIPCTEECPGYDICFDEEPDYPIGYKAWFENQPKLEADYDEASDSYIMPEPKVEEAPDMIDQPDHYAKAEIPSGIECWDWYELAMTEEEFAGHMKGNVLKYTFRAGRKEDAVQDLEKARAYMKRWIKYLNGERTVHMRGHKNGSQV